SRKNSSDGRTSGEKNPELKSEAFAHSKNRSNFEFWRSQVESSTVESSRVTSSPQTIQQPLQSAICSVNLGSSGDGTLSADSGVSTTRQPNQQKNVDVEREVESATPKGGDETAATQDDATTAAAAAEILTEAGSSDIVSAGLKENKQQLLEQQQQQNPKPKPILKRQDVPISIVALPPATTLPPPILKKRDSFSGGSSSSSGINECYSSAQQSCAIHVQNVITSAKPASILKNRQPRGSYSFDENVHVNDVPSSSFDDGAHLLKPILKKKSWSIEEKVAVSTNSSNLNEAVKGILKTSSDKLASFSASSSRKNSAVDELAVLSISSAITQSSSTASPTKATLKGILKTSPKNRSASISPSSSFEALSDDTELDAVPLPPSSPKPTTSAAMFCREVSTQEEEYSPPDVPSSDSIMSYSDFTVQQHQHEQLCNEDSANSQPVPAVAAASSARPALFKTISVHASSDSDSPSGSPLSSSETHTSDCSVSQQQSVPSSQIDDAVNDDDVDDDESPSQESSADTALTSDHESCEETDL
ncbi:PREDICTED: uncharacterized protein LOC108353851, partial [Rhagoletis zephyria]|uniref:uncharacterized protein LOC108353851 n=1 Tax=Rhagoletis zephyria TaxID=28612 RepID=UPI0008116C73